jgi:hypothetical protein
MVLLLQVIHHIRYEIVAAGAADDTNCNRNYLQLCLQCPYVQEILS